MRNRLLLFLLDSVLTIALIGCGSSVSPEPTAVVFTQTSIPPAPTPTSLAPTVSTTQTGKTILVTSAEDSGPGTLRQALLDAETGDLITFDPLEFPPNNPVSIKLMSSLPSIVQGHLTLDASNAGVVLDGSQVGGDWPAGIEINSEHNHIKGLQIIHFTGPGIQLNAQAIFNSIGGDRNIGNGLLGEGNLIGDTSDGIAIWGSDNTIAGNLIGIDIAGTGLFGNRGPGIIIEDNASRNVIGPNNIIAFNGTIGGGGIEIRSVHATGNAITANSIYDNSSSGILYNISGDAQGLLPSIPVILDLDLTSGMVGGIACPGCIVEFFSTSKTDGEIFEGTATADDSGNFYFSKGQPFSGPSLTATSRSTDSNTSSFSVPTIIPFQLAILQEGNIKPRARIVNKILAELNHNYIGDVFDGASLIRYPLPCPAPEEEESFTHVAELGFTWVRLSVDRLEWEPVRDSGDYSRFEINQCQDEVISLLFENNVTMVFTIVYWNEDLHSQRPPNYGNEDEINQFLEYTRFLVRHFCDRIEYFEILNEAVHYVELADYIELVRRAEQVIRQESPTARVVAGGTSNLFEEYNRDYLFGFLRSDIMPLIDAINIHPMYGASPEFNDLSQYYYEYPNLVSDIKRMAAEHGFTGEYIAEELTWRTSITPNPNEPWEYTEPVAAKYYARGIVIHRGMGMWAAIGGVEYERMPSIVQVVRSLTAILDGAEPEPLEVYFESQASNLTSYTFSTPNGDRLIALWADGTAVNYDPGVVVTITIPGFSANEVIGIDPFNGYEQQLDIESSNNNIVIKNLLVKDYPIFLRIVPFE